MLERPVVVIYANPRQRTSRLNRPLAQALAAMEDVEVRDLYRRYPDYDIDVVDEQRALARAATIVLQFPLSWFGMPPLLKLWFDEVLERAWAYGPGGTALRGKTCVAVVSTRGKAEAYAPGGTHGHPVEAFLLPVERAATLCGMTWRPPITVFDAWRLDAAAVADTVARITALVGATKGEAHEPA